MNEGELMVNRGELMVIFVVDLMVNFGRQRLTRVSFSRPQMSPAWRDTRIGPHEGVIGWGVVVGSGSGSGSGE